MTMRTLERIALAAVAAVTTATVSACDSGLDPAASGDDPSALESSEQALSLPGPPIPCGSPPHKSSKISVNNPSETYTRPFACQNWTVHQATFTIPASHPYRKLWVSHEFDYANLSNPEGKCEASKVEFKTERQVNLGSVIVWLMVDSGSATPHYVDSTKHCYWHNYNGHSGTTAPGTVVERISARALRYTGSYDQVSTGARIQCESIP